MVSALRITAEETLAFSVQVPDEPGALGRIAERLGDANINLRGYAVSGPPGATSGNAYLVTDEPGRTAETLEAAGHAVEEITAVLVTTPDQPGRLARVATTLAQQGIDIEASFVIPREGGPGLDCVLAVDAPEVAIQALEPLVTT